MASIDQRIVSMVFENAKFEAGIKTSMDSLKKFNDALNKTGNTKGFSDIDKAASKVNLSGPMGAIGKVQGALGRMGTFAGQGFSAIDKAGSKLGLTGPITALNKVQTAVTGVGRNAPDAFNAIEKSANHVDFGGLTSALSTVQSQFSVMSGAAAVALGNITSKIIEVGSAVTKDLTISPVMEGFHNYETQIQAVQTIVANTGLKGSKGMKQITDTLKELQKYANLTVYNFSDMTKNIGTFTAAGVDLKTATGAIKGIANLAAMSGSTPDQAASAMYQLSQAIAAGQVKLQDWNSVVNAGIGGTVFQRALAQTAEQMGKLEKGSVKLVGPMRNVKIAGENFRTSLQTQGGKPSWLTSEVLTRTLQQFTGDLKNSQLAAQGFSKAQIKAIQDQAKIAVDSATQIKTLSQMMQALKEEVGTAWATIWKTLFGNLAQAKNLFSPLHTFIENGLTIPIYNFQKVLQSWADMGGRIKFIDALKQGYKDIQSIIKPIQQAFRDIFPPETAKGLMSMTDGFASLMKRLQATPEVMQNIRNTFDGFFAVLHIGWTIFKEVAKVFGDVLGIAGKGAGGLLNFTGGIGVFLKSLDEAISRGHALEGFFKGIGAGLGVPIKLLKTLGSAFLSLFNIGSFHDAKKSLDSVGNSFDTLKKKGGPVVDVIVKIANIVGTIQNWLSPVVKTLTTEVGHLFTELADRIRNANFNDIGSILTAGLMAGIFGTLKKGFSGGLSVYINSFSDVLKGLSGVFNGLTAQLKAMQRAVVSTTILKIAIAIGILAASTYVLSTIDAKKLAQSMAAIAIGMGELVGVMKLMDGSMGGGKFIGLKMGGMASSLVILASALVILAGAMKIMSSMSWEELAKGLVGIGGGLAVMAGAMALFTRTGAGGFSLIATGIGLEFVATAMVILAAAAKEFSSMSWANLAKGLVGMGGALVALNVGVIGLGPELLVVGPGLLVTAMAVAMLSGAVASFGHIPLKNMILGILGMGAAIAMLAYEIELIPPTVALQGAGLLVVAAALEGLAAVVATFGKMNIFSIIKGIIAMGAALGVLALGIFAIGVASAGGAGTLALLGAAAALALLAPTLAFMGTLKWSTILRGLAAIAAVLGVLAIAGLVAAAPIAALGAALFPWGVVLLEAATAILIFSKAMQLLGKEGTKGVGIFIGAMTAFIALIPHMILGMVTGILEGVKMFAKIMPQLVDALDKMLTTAIGFIVKEAPKIGVAIGEILDVMVSILSKNAPKLIDAGLKLIVALLSGISKNIGKITSSAALIVTGFLAAWAKKIPGVVRAGIDVILGFLRGVASKAGAIVRTAIDVVVHWLSAVASQGGRIASAGVRIIGKFIAGIAGHIHQLYNTGIDLVVKILDGIASVARRVISGAVHIASVFIHGFAHGLITLADTAATALIDFLNGLASVIRKRAPQIRAAGWNLASAMVDGILGGFGELWHKITDKITDLAHKLPGWFRKPLGIHSPSTIFHEIGLNTMQGLHNGINAGSEDVEKAAGLTGKRLSDAMRKSMTNSPGLLDGIMPKNPTIKPVLDLSEIKKGAGEIGKHLGTSHLAVGVSASQAGAISLEKAKADKAQAEAVAAAAKPSMVFEQHNTSPEPLSTAEIYRRTNNQISQIKKAVGIHEPTVHRRPK